MDSFINLMSDDLRARLFELWERTGDDGLRRIAEGEAFPTDAGSPRFDSLGLQEQSDWMGTALMNSFKDTADPHVFALLYELASPSFRATIVARMRRTMTQLDAHDVLQEVFLNIFRYPHRFVAERADSFRNWGHTIVRNTLLKMLKGESRRGRPASLDDEIVQQADERAHTPLRSATDAESAEVVDRAFLIYLNLYLVHFARLSAKEQRALSMVEVLGVSYKETAAELGIRLENLKMVIFRARRKVMRGMTRTLSEFAARNARRIDARHDEARRDLAIHAKQARRGSNATRCSGLDELASRSSDLSNLSSSA